MSNPSKQRGTAWESALVRFLQDADYPRAERRALAGSADRGDIAGVAVPDGGVMIEAKSCKAFSLAGWMDEVAAETKNAGARFGVCWIKRRGKTSPGAGYVVMSGDTFLDMLAGLRCIR